jgi:hypothetical protein
MDILQLKLGTTAVTHTTFSIENNFLHVFDTIGLKIARDGWTKYFDCQCMIFFVALDSYDQMMEEDSNMNRMADSIELFKCIVDNPILSEASIILFLNKKDLYEKKVKTIRISDYFPDYTGKSD